jgi:hypothetical protein
MHARTVNLYSDMVSRNLWIEMMTSTTVDLINKQGPIDRDKRWVCRECGTENNVGEACVCGNETE